MTSSSLNRLETKPHWFTDPLLYKFSFRQETNMASTLTLTQTAWTHACNYKPFTHPHYEDNH